MRLHSVVRKTSQLRLSHSASLLSNVLSSPPSAVRTLPPSSTPSPEELFHIILSDERHITDHKSSEGLKRHLSTPKQAVLWQGDYHKGKLMLQSLSQLLKSRRSVTTHATAAEQFLHNRETVLAMNQFLSHFLVPFQKDYIMKLPRSPPLKNALEAAFGEYNSATTLGKPCSLLSCDESSTCTVDDDIELLVPLREVIGAVGSYEWRKKGVFVPAINTYIYPHFSVFSPTSRQEYIQLLADVELPSGGDINLAYEVGVGTGVLSALLLQRGVKHVVGTDVNPRALVCAHDNLRRLNLLDKVTLQESYGFPIAKEDCESRCLVDLIVCNPPWIPLTPCSLLDKGVYDENSLTLKHFILNVRHHLNPEKGECFLILSDLAELLGLRTRKTLLNFFEMGGLEVVGTIQTRPVHHRAFDESDPVHHLRSKEITTLWRLKCK